MRVDVVSIFPAYLAPLDLSLPGKARERGLLDLRVHDLRTWAHDRHRTVDDTPYGGGAGMVMKPEPWGEALDAILDGATGSPVLVVPTPSGVPFTQAAAAALASEEHLVVACGRYEGIDQRVVDHAATRMRVREVSIGDYVLNGGEVAALVIVEAVVRLLPGFMGNAGSLAEESHGSDGLLEYPVYTKPASWRGLDVPDVLLSGDHARVAAWRHEQAVRRTTERRPDLLHPSRRVVAGAGVEGDWRTATRADAGELLTLQRACGGPHDSLEGVLAELGPWTTFVLRCGGRLLASVRGRPAGDEWQVGQVLVAPDLQDQGLEQWLLEQAEQAAPPDAARIGVVTEGLGEKELRWLRKAGYRPARTGLDAGRSQLSKRRR